MEQLVEEPEAEVAVDSSLEEGEITEVPGGCQAVPPNLREMRTCPICSTIVDNLKSHFRSDHSEMPMHPGPKVNIPLHNPPGVNSNKRPHSAVLINHLGVDFLVVVDTFVCTDSFSAIGLICTSLSCPTVPQRQFAMLFQWSANGYQLGFEQEVIITGLSEGSKMHYIQGSTNVNNNSSGDVKLVVTITEFIEI